jgi:hypothetical protein
MWGGEIDISDWALLITLVAVGTEGGNGGCGDCGTFADIGGRHLVCVQFQ